MKLLASALLGSCDLLQRPFGSRPGRCVVINYHSVSDESRPRFGRQLDLLLQLARPVRAGSPLRMEPGRRFVAITVDDVFSSFVRNGLPELCRRNIPVMLFPPTGFLGKASAWEDRGGENKIGESVASAADLESLARSGNVDFGSHGVSHADLARLPEAEAWRELVDSKKMLEAIVGREVVALSFPYGSCGARELRLAREAGYRFFYDSTPQQWSARLGEGLSGRVDVQPTDGDLEFRLKVCGAYRWVRSASAWKRKIRSWSTLSTKNSDRD